MKKLFLFLLLLPFNSQAANFGGKSEMNGYSINDYPNFDSEWRLVTVRFRTDKREMRFTYANDIAYKALISGSNQYPDGSVFAKIGAITAIDPKFPSSEVPSGTLRYQLMVKDSKKHKKTDGWGYALFDANKLTFAEDPKAQETACHACHKIVPEKGFVFSERMQISPFKPISTTTPIVEQMKMMSNFQLKKRGKLTQQVQALLPAEFKEIYNLEHDMRDHVFQGTLDEIVPTLILQTKKTGKPAGFFNRDETRFSLIVPDSSGASCKIKGQTGISYSLISTLPSKTEDQKLYQTHVSPICNSDLNPGSK